MFMFFILLISKRQFLPWHRWYLMKMENILRKIDCRATIPYWDWSLFSGQPWRRQVGGKPLGVGDSKTNYFENSTPLHWARTTKKSGVSKLFLSLLDSWMIFSRPLPGVLVAMVVGGCVLQTDHLTSMHGKPLLPTKENVSRENLMVSSNLFILILLLHETFSHVPWLRRSVVREVMGSFLQGATIFLRFCFIRQPARCCCCSRSPKIQV